MDDAFCVNVLNSAIRRYFTPMVGLNLDNILCEQYERKVRADNCVHFEKKSLQIPKNEYRFHYVKVKVRVHRYSDGSPNISRT